MPRELTFQIKRKEYTSTPIKVDRKKLYGWTEILALDEQGRECNLITTDQTGMLMIPKSGTSLGILSPKGEWVERDTLITVNQDGSPAELVLSSYSIPITLNNKISEEDFLDYSITDFYELVNTSDDLVKQIGKNIYMFDYTYLDSYETSPAFLMVSENILFMLVGYKNKFEYLCLGDCEVIDEDQDDYIEINDDDIDFSMF